MRERLTFAFVALTLLLLVGAGAIRSFAIEDQLREHETRYLARDAQSIATGVAAGVADGNGSGDGVDARLLRRYASEGTHLSYSHPGRPTVSSDGPGADAAGQSQISSDVPVDGGVLTVSRPLDNQIDTMGRANLTSLIGLFALMALLAGVIGYLVARALSQPFRQLATAAAALGRGRFDLDLPDTKVPEARAISSALCSSATQLKDRIEREREFGLHASHVLRTPLTSLRFHLEELVGDPALSTDAREAALGGLKAVGRLNQVTTELIDISGHGVLVAGAAQPLRDIATLTAQRWADRLLEDHGRQLTAGVEGDIELAFTPGPIEQVLDLVLSDVVLPDDGDVRVVFEGAASRLRVDIACVDDGVQRPPRREVGVDIESTLSALGGRVEVPADASVLRVHLPRR